MINISQPELSESADVGVATLRRLEGGDNEGRGTVQVLLKIRRALEAKGIIFIDQDGKQGPGVRLRKPIR